MNGVTVTDEKRMLPSYGEPEAEELPMFAENRVHQRSSGDPYPNRVVLQVDRAHRAERPFRIITLENEYLRLELMPEKGGRIWSALDKRTGYDFFYRQHVVKPALIGMLGSWISGGCEFNWPCHHRPSTFMPVDVHIEREDGGAVTVWMSENEPLDRMKGMVGIRLAPGEARFDTRVKVYNRTPERHSFLWWENTAVPVNPDYRLVFPPDVSYVQFHYRKNVTTFPVATGVYNGIRMGGGTDISRHGNTEHPTSYFCAATKYDFFGGYDEKKQCGVMHVADHTVSVGKKMFTWAYSQLAESWERALTDTDGPYAELMASSYSLNQPDFAWLMPYEAKEFSQMWIPAGATGVPVYACREAVFGARGGKLNLQAAVPLAGAVLELDGKTYPVNAGPGEIVSFALENADAPGAFSLTAADGRVLARFVKAETALDAPMPATLPDNPPLDALRGADEAYLLGVHCEQYRDPSVRPEKYWLEALRRDPDHIGALTAMARSELRHFRPERALAYAEHAWRRVTLRNFHPESGGIQYLLGRVTEALGRDDDAYEWYMQAAWAQDSRSRALTRAAALKGRAGDRHAMRELAEKALDEYPRNETAAVLAALSCPEGTPERARALASLLARDPLYPTARALAEGASPAFYESLQSDARQTLLDIAEELCEAGETAFAAKLLEKLPEKCAQTEYVRFLLTGDGAAAEAAKALGPGVAFPSRAIEVQAMRRALERDPDDTRAMYLLACVLYHADSHAEAAALWERAAARRPNDWASLRCLAAAYYSHLGRRAEALPLLERALAARPHDAQLLREHAYVFLRTGGDPGELAERLRREDCPREDVVIELCRALNLAGRYQEALAVLEKHAFTPCEGGEHAVAEEYMFAHHALGRAALARGADGAALAHFRAAQELPQNLGAGLWNEVLLVPHRYYEAECLLRSGRAAEAADGFRWILSFQKDYFTDMHLPELPCWQAAALRQLSRDADGTERAGLLAQARQLLAEHLRAQDEAARHIDPGYAKTTPFFLSYMEDAAAERQTACAWQRAMTAFAAEDPAAAEAQAAKVRALDPTHLYASLFARGVDRANGPA